MLIISELWPQTADIFWLAIKRSAATLSPRRATDLLRYAVQGFWTTDVKAYEHGVRVGVSQRSHVVVVGGTCGRKKAENNRRCEQRFQAGDI